MASQLVQNLQTLLQTFIIHPVNAVMQRSVHFSANLNLNNW